MSHSSQFKVPGFSHVLVSHNGDWSGDTTIYAYKEGRIPPEKQPGFEDKPDFEVVIPDGILPAIFKSVVREFLSTLAEEALERLVNFAGNRNPWR